MTPTRYTPTTKDVVEKLRSSTRPSGSGDILYGIAYDITTTMSVERPDSIREAEKHVSASRLRSLLKDLVDRGLLIARTGREWEARGSTWYDQRPSSTYYALPDNAARWEDAEQRKQNAARREKAHRAALEALAEEFPDAYVRHLQAALDKLTGEAL